jgi:hypothetical protein
MVLPYHSPSWLGNEKQFPYNYENHSQIMIIGDFSSDQHCCFWETVCSLLLILFYQFYSARIPLRRKTTFLVLIISFPHTHRHDDDAVRSKLALRLPTVLLFWLRVLLYVRCQLLLPVVWRVRHHRGPSSSSRHSILLRMFSTAGMVHGTVRIITVHVQYSSTYGTRRSSNGFLLIMRERERFDDSIISQIIKTP